MPLTDEEMENKILELESALEYHDHIVLFENGGGGADIKKNALTSELSTEINNNSSHRLTLQKNPHETRAHQILITSGSYQSHNIEEALNIIENDSQINYGELEEFAAQKTNTIKTGDAVTNWTTAEASTKNNRALFDLIGSHKHDSRYLNIDDFNNEIDRHYDSDDHDERYYTKDKMNSDLNLKSNKTHLHDDIYLRRNQLDDLYFNVADDELNIDLELIKNSPKVILDDKSTNGKNIQFKSTNERLEVEINNNLAATLKKDFNVLTSGEIKLRGTPVSLEGHIHDNRYYTETETQDLLKDKSEKGHVHDHIYYRESEVDNFLDGKTDVGHVHVEHYTREQADDRFVNVTTDSIEKLTVEDKLIMNERIDLHEKGMLFKSYMSGINVSNDPGGELSMKIDAGNLDQLYLDTDKVKVRRNLEVVGDIELGHLINGVNIEDLNEDYNYHKAQSDSHHEKYTDREARVAIYNDSNHYDLSNHQHNHNDIYYKKDFLDSRFDQKSDKGHDHDDQYMPIDELQKELDNKSDIDHLHDDRYYTKDKMNEQITLIGDELARKSNKTHDHNEEYYTHDDVERIIEERTGNSTYIVSGEIVTDINGRATLPIPSGFLRQECHYMASIGENTLIPYSSSGIDINRSNGEIRVRPSSVDSVNYIVIGVR